MKITKFIPPSEEDLLQWDYDSDECRKLLHWYNPPPVRLHPQNLQEFLIWRNPANPISNFKTKRFLAEEYCNVSVPRFECGQTSETLYNKYLNQVVVPYCWGKTYQIDQKYLSWPCESYGAKRPDLTYWSNKTGKVVISEVKMFYNILNFSHAEHVLSAIDQLLLMDILLKKNEFPEEYDLELVILTHEGVLSNLRSVIQKMHAINESRHLDIGIKILNVFIPWEEFKAVRDKKKN